MCTYAHYKKNLQCYKKNLHVYIHISQKKLTCVHMHTTKKFFFVVLCCFFVLLLCCFFVVLYCFFVVLCYFFVVCTWNPAPPRNQDGRREKRWIFLKDIQLLFLIPWGCGVTGCFVNFEQLLAVIP